MYGAESPRSIYKHSKNSHGYIVLPRKKGVGIETDMFAALKKGWLYLTFPK